MITAIFLALAAAPLDVPFFEQKKNGCGAASVAMVMEYWRDDVDAAKVYAELGGNAAGGTALDAMRKYLEDAGFRAFTLRGEWSDIEKHLEKRRPLIVALRPGPSKRLHFAVVAGVDTGHVRLNDPTRRNSVQMKRSNFEKQWTLAEKWMLVAAPARN